MPTGKTNSWIVPLKGHDFDIEELPIYLQDCEVCVQKRDDKYFLVLPTSVTGPTYDEVGRLARERLNLINGVGSLLLEVFHPIEIGDGPYFGIDACGKITQTVIELGTAEIRCKTGNVTALVNGVPQPDLRTGQATRLINTATTSSGTSDALVIVGRHEPSWSELYLVYELVESNVGGRMYLDGWIGRKEGKLFTWTANSYTALGRSSRHGKDQRIPPPHPMPHPTAIKLIRSLVLNWLRWLDDSLESTD